MRFGHPYMHPHLDHSNIEVRGWSRRQWRDVGQPMHLRLKAVEGDALAFRELILRTHGLETLWNIIRMDHGSAKRY